MHDSDDILVVPRVDVDALGLLDEGLSRVPADVIERLEACARWMPRSLAEEDPSFKQLIPYVVAVDGDSVFVMERLDAGGEPRLHGRLSIGVGGHVDRLSEPSVRGAVLRARDREWTEEVACSHAVTFAWVGTINVDTDAVGRVHLGLVFRAELPSGARLDVRETHKLRGALRTATWCHEARERLETWSALVLDELALS